MAAGLVLLAGGNTQAMARVVLPPSSKQGVMPMRKMDFASPPVPYS